MFGWDFQILKKEAHKQTLNCIYNIFGMTSELLTHSMEKIPY